MKAFGMTDKGLIRHENQDHFRIEYPGDKTLLIVCDGMGGAKGGATASELACKALLSNLTLALSKLAGEEDATLMTEAVSYANLAVYEKSRTGDECEGMGTTLVSAMVTGSRCSVVNVGDSRAYHFRDGACTQITRDHSLVEELVSLGELSRDSEDYKKRKNILTRAVGIESTVRIDLFDEELRNGDYLLMCSDGLSNMVDDDEIVSTVTGTGSVIYKANELVRKANQNGGTDNIAVILIRFTEGGDNNA